MVICKESSKPSKLSTKLSTIWQINDYLSKKIDNRLIVDIIDTRGHPAFSIDLVIKGVWQRNPVAGHLHFDSLHLLDAN